MSIAITLLFHLHQESEAERSSPHAYAETLDLITQADALPVECAWLAEHHLLPTRGRLPAPLLLAVAAARQTRRIRVGPCVLVAPLHHPLDLAEQIASADLLCEGRLAVGLGSGGNPEEFAAFGVPLEERRTRFAEGVEIIARALRGVPFSHHGAHYTIPEVELVPRPLQPVAAMLWVAAGSADSAALAGRSGAHLLLARGTPTPALHEQIGAYRAARAASGYARATAQIQLTRGFYAAESEDAAWREAEGGIRRHYKRLARYANEEVPLPEMARRGDFIIGTPAQCAEQIAALCAEVPLTHLACDISLIGAPHEHIARSLDLLGSAVVPALGD